LLTNWIILPKKRHSKIKCKWLTIKAKVGHGGALKNVLTVKKGLFLGLLAGKRGVGAKEKSLYFAFLHVLVTFCFCKLLSVSQFRRICASKKIVPKSLQ
jgi:hypothetical protein